MTVNDILLSRDFNQSSISNEIFGNKRIISDKLNGNRNKRWRIPEDDLLIKNYFEKKYKINLDM